MSDAPKRIWVDYSPHTESYEAVSLCGDVASTKYIRADIVAGLVKALDGMLEVFGSIDAPDDYTLANLERATNGDARHALAKYKEAMK